MRDECPSIAESVNFANCWDTRRLTSAYGLSSWMEKSSDAVAAWNLAAAESLPTFPGELQQGAL